MGEICTGMERDTCPDTEPIQGVELVPRVPWVVGRDGAGSAPTFAPGWAGTTACFALLLLLGLALTPPSVPADCQDYQGGARNGG